MLRLALAVLLIPAVAQGDAEIALRTGLMWPTRPPGTQMLGEVEVGSLVSRDVSASLFGDYGGVSWDSRGRFIGSGSVGDIRFVDVGARGRVHVGHSFFGGSAGYEWRRETVSMESLSGETMSTTDRSDALLLEIHAGLETQGASPHLEAIISAIATNEVVGIRLAFGVRL